MTHNVRTPVFLRMYPDRETENKHLHCLHPSFLHSPFQHSHFSSTHLSPDFHSPLYSSSCLHPLLSFPSVCLWLSLFRKPPKKPLCSLLLLLLCLLFSSSLSLSLCASFHLVPLARFKLTYTTSSARQTGSLIEFRHAPF